MTTVKQATKKLDSLQSGLAHATHHLTNNKAIAKERADYIRELQAQLVEAEAQLTKPLEAYANRYTGACGWGDPASYQYIHKGAQRVHLLRQQVASARGLLKAYNTQRRGNAWAKEIAELEAELPNARLALDLATKKASKKAAKKAAKKEGPPAIKELPSHVTGKELATIAKSWGKRLVLLTSPVNTTLYGYPQTLLIGDFVARLAKTLGANAEIDIGFDPVEDSVPTAFNVVLTYLVDGILGTVTLCPADKGHDPRTYVSSACNIPYRGMYFERKPYNQHPPLVVTLG
jgi:hypothetical protein